MDPVVVFLIIILSVLTILLAVVGIQVYFLVHEARQALKKYDRILTKTDKIVGHVSASVDEISQTVSGMKSGLKLVEAFSHWVEKNQHRHELISE